MRYYDPKTDVVFKKVFGEHKNLTISLLNAVLKLEGDDVIKDVDYQPSEIIPVVDGTRRSAVDVRCKVSDDDYFIVEMQMWWSSDFLRRVLYNCSKIYATLYNQGVRYYGTKRVFAVNILNDIYQHDTESNYHRYTMSEIGNPSSTIPGIEVVCIELPKFKPQNYAQSKMLRLWQSFLTAIDARNGSVDIPGELLETEETKEALTLCQHLTDDERRAYDSFWDLESMSIDRENTVLEMGIAKGRVQGLSEGLEKGAKQQSIAIARQMKADGMPVDLIVKYSGLTPEELAEI